MRTGGYEGVAAVFDKSRIPPPLRRHLPLTREARFAQQDYL